MPHDRLAVRLGVLSREQLLALAAAGCAADAKLCARADELIVEANSFPGWCANALLSPDVLSQLLGKLELCDWRVASVSSAWAAGWAAMLAQRQFVNPKRPLSPPRVLKLRGECPSSDERMPEGTTCLASCSTQPDNLTTQSDFATTGVDASANDAAMLKRAQAWLFGDGVSEERGADAGVAGGVEQTIRSSVWHALTMVESPGGECDKYVFSDRYKYNARTCTMLGCW